MVQPTPKMVRAVRDMLGSKIKTAQFFYRTYGMSIKEIKPLLEEAEKLPSTDSKGVILGTK